MTGVLAVLAAARKLSPITVSANWGVALGASPQASANRALTVPAGNPGVIKFTAVVSSATFQYSKNAGAFATVVDNATVSVANGDSIQFKLTGVSFDNAGLTVIDNTTGTSIGTWIASIS